MTTERSPYAGRVHGRRRGRPLRPRRRRLIDALLPELAIKLDPAGAGELDPAGAGGPIDPAALFGRPPRDCWLEIGFGAGEHLAQQAAAHPDIGFIGCEPFINGVAGLLAQIEDRGLDNIRLFTDNAALLLEALPAATIGRTFLLFPDPWPKKRHAGRRFVSGRNIAALARVMKTGAELRLATDSPDHVDWIDGVMAGDGAFSRPDRPSAPGDDRPADWPETRYERKARAAGRRCRFFIYRRNPAPAAGD